MSVAEENLPLQRIWHWERARADKPYLTQPMGNGQLESYSWSRAVGESRRMAAYLQAQGFEPGSRIAILSKNCAHWIMSDFAIWMAGYVSVPLYPTLTADSVRHVLEHSEAKAVFVGKLDDWPMMKPGIPEGMPCISYPLSPPNEYPSWNQIVSDTAPLTGTPTRDADDLATIIYTSGTTGLPKGVMMNFGAIGWAPEPMEAGFGITAEDRVLSYLPLAHVAERWTVESCSIRAGFHIYFAESLDTFLQDLQRARPTMFISVPRLWVKFQQGIFSKIPKKKLDRLFKIPLLGSLIKKKILKQLGLDTVRFAGSGAAPLPVSVLEWYRELGLDLLEGYGMSENFGCSHGSFPGQSRVGYVGSPWPGVECKLSETGEVLVRSPATTTGYYKAPDKTAETFTEDGFLKTGDLGEIDEQNRLKITGRAKELFKTSKGKYVAPAPIENKLSAHPAIEAVCVAGANQGQPCALVMLNEDAAAHCADASYREELSESLTALLESVNASVDPHERLQFITVVNDPWTVEGGFLTPTLKIKRNVVEDTYGAQLDGWYGKRQQVIWEKAA